MYCIISDTALYSEIKQRPLAALLIHFSPPLSFVGMPGSVQSAVFKIPAHLDSIWGSLCLSAVYCCCPFRRPWASATLLWHMRCVHAALVIVEPQSVLNVNRAERREKPLGDGAVTHRVVSSLSLRLSGMSRTVNALRGVSSAALQRATQHSPKISVYDRVKVGRGWAGPLFSP